MPTDPPRPDGGEVTRLLRDLQDGVPGAGDRLIPLLYDELRRLAGSFMANERPGHTLQPTALINEAYLRLAGQRGSAWQSRSHFLSLAATAMRRVLVDHARARATDKRGGGKDPLTLREALSSVGADDVDLLDLHQALDRLTELDPRQGKIVEMRFFGGLDVEEVAEIMGVSSRTVKREWRHARAWLSRELAA